MLCPNCKKEIENGSAFCEHCGACIKKSKKGLWIMLSVIFIAAVVTIVVITVQEQIAMERYRVEQRQLELEQQLQAERKAREEAEYHTKLRIFQNEVADFQRKLVNNDFLSREQAEKEHQRLLKYEQELKELEAKLSTN